MVDVFIAPHATSSQIIINIIIWAIIRKQMNNRLYRTSLFLFLILCVQRSHLFASYFCLTHHFSNVSRDAQQKVP